MEASMATSVEHLT